MSLFKNRPLAATAFFVFLGSLTAYLIANGGMTREIALIPLFLLVSLLIGMLFFLKKTRVLFLLLVSATLIGYSSQILYDHLTFSDIRALDSSKIHKIEERYQDKNKH